MNFKICNTAGWIQHSQHLQVMNKSIRYAQLEHNKSASASAKFTKYHNRSDADNDKSKNKLKSAVPQRRKEHCAIVEFIQMNKLVSEIPARKHDQTSMCNSMKKIANMIKTEKTRSNELAQLHHITRRGRMW